MSSAKQFALTVHIQVACIETKVQNTDSSYNFPVSGDTCVSVWGLHYSNNIMPPKGRTRRSEWEGNTDPEGGTRVQRWTISLTKKEICRVVLSSSPRPNVLKMLCGEETHFTAGGAVPHRFDLDKSLSS